MGVEFYSKIITLDDDTNIKLQIWDTAGQETFRSIIKTFYRSSAAVFLVYNIAKYPALYLVIPLLRNWSFGIRRLWKIVILTLFLL
jgi:GTPase SAR1 family protein